MGLDFALVTPIYHGVDGITCWCVEKAHHAGLNNFLWVMGTDGKGDALICRNRSSAATSFMEASVAEYMIFLDSDIQFEPTDLQMIHKDLIQGYDIVGGMYPVRSGTDNSSYFYEGKGPQGPPGIYEIQFLSTGFMGISKYALQKIVREYKYPDTGKSLPLLHGNTPEMRSYPFFEAKSGHIDVPDASGTTEIWMSEDWDFCSKARSVGFKIWADTRVLLGHQGNRIVTFKDVEEFKKKKKELEEEQKRKLAEETKKIKDVDLPDYVGISSEDANA